LKTDRLLKWCSSAGIDYSMIFVPYSFSQEINTCAHTRHWLERVCTVCMTSCTVDSV